MGFQLIIKGSLTQAIEAARAKGLDVRSARELRYAQTSVEVRDVGEAAETRIESWFGESNDVLPGEKFPVGSLLFYAGIRQD
jgi:hypothetical protein